MTLPAEAPTWLILLVAVASWIAAKVWPLFAAMISARSGAATEILRAKAEAELARTERELENEEERAKAERQIGEALLKLGELVQVNITETRQNTQILTSLTTAFSAQIGQMPTLRDIQQMTDRISAIEAHMAMDNPARFGRRDHETHVWPKAEGGTD